MALSLTTLSGAVPLVGNTIQVVSATGVVVGGYILIDQEFMQVMKGYPLANKSALVVPVARGQEGTATQAHATAAQVKIGLASDFTAPAPQAIVSQSITSPARVRISYSAAGAITLPTPGNDMDAVLNGTSVLAMTLANPTTESDGSRLVIMGNGIAAHTVTYAAGFGNVGGTADVVTFGTTQAQSVSLVACGGFWLLLGPLVTATANVSGPAVA